MQILPKVKVVGLPILYECFYLYIVQIIQIKARYCALRISSTTTTNRNEPPVFSSTVACWSIWARIFSDSHRICGAQKLGFITTTMHLDNELALLWVSRQKSLGVAFTPPISTVSKTCELPSLPQIPKVTAILGLFRRGRS